MEVESADDLMCWAFEVRQDILTEEEEDEGKVFGWQEDSGKFPSRPFCLWQTELLCDITDTFISPVCLQVKQHNDKEAEEDEEEEDEDREQKTNFYCETVLCVCADEAGNISWGENKKPAESSFLFLLNTAEYSLSVPRHPGKLQLKLLPSLFTVEHQ